MEQALRDRPGGIAGLVALPRDDWEAIEADLLDRGFVLDDVPGRVSWRAVKAMIRWSDRTSAVIRQRYGDDVAWTPGEHLTALAVDSLRALVWMQSEDGRKNRNRPKPLPRPGQQKPKATGQQIGSAASAVPISEFWPTWNTGSKATPASAAV